MCVRELEDHTHPSVWEHRRKTIHWLILIILVSSITAGGYRLDGTVNGVPTPFLLDTGASATLLRKDTWDAVKSQSQNAEELKPCPEQRLMSVDGSTLHVHGKAEVELCLAGECFKVETMVVSPLTSEAILGLDFLRKYKATISLGMQCKQ